MKVVSPANSIGLRMLETFGKSLMYISNRRGSKMLPCGTPTVTVEMWGGGYVINGYILVSIIKI